MFCLKKKQTAAYVTTIQHLKDEINKFLNRKLSHLNTVEVFSTRGFWCYLCWHNLKFMYDSSLALQLHYATFTIYH